MNIKTSLIALAVVTVPCFSNAASLVNPKTASTDVTFYQPNQFSHTLTAATNLVSGNYDQFLVVASGVVKTLGATSATYAVQFPAANGASAGTRTQIPGKNDANNKLAVVLLLKDTGFGTNNIDGSAWYVTSAPLSTLNYQVALDINTSRTVVADIYPVTVTAAVYTN